MADIQTIFKIKQSQSFTRPERQNSEQIEDVVIKREVVATKLFLDLATNTYIIYNSVSGNVEIYKGGVLVAGF